MNPDEYHKMYQIEDKYWWFIGRRKLLNWVLQSYAVADKQELLFDLGCGTGLNLVSFRKHCPVVGGDSSLTALRFCRERSIETVFQCEAVAIPLKADSVGVVTALDVLEHFEHDLDALREIHRILKPGGLFVATVPAYGFLWSEHDEALHHFRRYTAREMRAKICAAGFELERTTYYISLLFIPILVYRLWQNLTGISHRPSVSYIMPPRWLNSWFVCLLDLEARIMRLINLPFGISIIAIAKKAPDDTEMVDSG